MRILKVVTVGLLLTCLADPEHNRYEIFQLDGPVLYDSGCLDFEDAWGFHDRVCDGRCSLSEGTLSSPGDDLRGEPAPGVPR